MSAASQGRLRQLAGPELRERFAGTIVRYADRGASPAEWEAFGTDGTYSAQLHRVARHGTYRVAGDQICVRTQPAMAGKRCRRAYVDESGVLKLDGPFEDQEPMIVSVIPIGG